MADEHTLSMETMATWEKKLYENAHEQNYFSHTVIHTSTCPYMLNWFLSRAMSPSLKNELSWSREQ